MSDSLPSIVPNPIAIIGAGPAGLMAAEVLAQAGRQVMVFDAMPSAGRKLLRAGIGGLNLTHGEDFNQFVTRYGSRQQAVASWLTQFDPTHLQAWARELGISLFTGSSGRVFPVGGKAAPLLRAWLRRLHGLGVQFRMRWRWIGWQDDKLIFQTADGQQAITAPAVVLALGGASWPQLGSDGAWVEWLAQRGVASSPLRPANCGFRVAWSDHFRHRFQRQPVKTVQASGDGIHWQRGELMLTPNGVEGGLVYALSAQLRDRWETEAQATLWLDLQPDRSLASLQQKLGQPRGNRSLAKHLKDKAGIEGVKAGLLREFVTAEELQQPDRLAQRIKALPVPLGAPFALDRAISTAGGVPLEALTAGLMLKSLPGVFCAGEMLDWEAPTGGYLLTACFASGRVAASAVQAWLEENATGLEDS